VKTTSSVKYKKCAAVKVKHVPSSYQKKLKKVTNISYEKVHIAQYLMPHRNKTTQSVLAKPMERSHQLRPVSHTINVIRSTFLSKHSKLRHSPREISVLKYFWSRRGRCLYQWEYCTTPMFTNSCWNRHNSH